MLHESPLLRTGTRQMRAHGLRASGDLVVALPPRLASRAPKRPGGAGCYDRAGQMTSKWHFGAGRARPQGASARRGRQPWIEAITGMSRIATMFAILIIGLIAGPAVSL